MRFSVSGFFREMEWACIYRERDIYIYGIDSVDCEGGDGPRSVVGRLETEVS